MSLRALFERSFWHPLKKAKDEFIKKLVSAEQLSN